MTLSSIDAEYVVITPAAKEAAWMRLFSTEMGLLDNDGQYVMIKVVKIRGIKQIKANAVEEKEEIVDTLSSIASKTASTPLTHLFQRQQSGINWLSS